MLPMKDPRSTPQRRPVEDPTIQPILTHDKFLPGKVAEGTEAKQILDQEIMVLGTQLVSQLRILLKTARVHDRTNAALDQVLNALLTTVKTLTQDKPAVLRLQDDFLYLNEMHLKMNTQLIAIFLEFIDSLNAREIGAISFTDKVQVDSLREFAYLFITFDPKTSTIGDLRKQMEERQVLGIGIEEATSYLMRMGTKFNQPKIVAKNLYLKAVGAVGGVMQSIGNGQKPNLKQAKRVIQNIVDLIRQDESMLLGLTTLRCYDQYTHNHSVNVSLLSLALANRVGYPKAALEDLGVAALFHDMGKTSIPFDILNKSEELNAEDWDKMRTHPVQGVINLTRLRGFKNLPGRMAAAAFEHHMNYDFSGFPKLCVPWEQSLTGRILMIADCYDAMTSSRVYRRQPIAPGKALKRMFSKSGQSFDPVLLKLFVNCVGILPIGSLVLLDSHELAVVVRPGENRKATERPWVRLITDSHGNPIEGPEVDLEEADSDGTYKRSIVNLVDNTEYRFDTSRYFV